MSQNTLTVNTANTITMTEAPFADTERSVVIEGQRARYYDLSVLDKPVKTATLPPAHFYGGNGFTAGVYEPLLTDLSQQFAVTSLAMRGYWHDLPTKPTLTREQDADMLIAFLEQMYSQPVIGIGHSQGATATALAAAKRPDLFSQLYLIEPVTFTKQQKIAYDLLPRALKMRQEPFKSTSVKQTHWDSVTTYYEHLRAHHAFKRISDEHLYTFAHNSLVPAKKGGFELLFSPAQEMANYFGTPYINGALQKLNKAKLAYTLIVGKPTIFISNKVRASWQGIVAEDDLITWPDYGHLLPMEAPEQCAKLIMERFNKA